MTGCTQLSLKLGAFIGKPFAISKEGEDHEAAFEARKPGRFGASCDGFNVHAGVTVSADSDEGREKLLRYCARPPIALDRIEVMRDGRIAYRLKYPRKGQTHRVMSPVEFIALMAAQIPPPYYPFLRYSSVLAPSSKMRKQVVLKPPPTRRHALRRADKQSLAAGSASRMADIRPMPCVGANGATNAEPIAVSTKSHEAGGIAGRPDMASMAPGRVSAGDAMIPNPSGASTKPIAELHSDPTHISLAHWGRLLDGELLATSSYVDWAKLMKRTLGFDGLDCPRCHGRLRIMSVIEDRSVAKKILEHLGLPSERRRFAPARDPAEFYEAEYGAA